MKLFLGMVLGLLWSKIFGPQPEKAVPKITAAATATTDRNSSPTDDDKGFSIETRYASPAHFLTKINSFSLFSQYGIEKYETKEFEAGDYKWRLIIYPDGRERTIPHVSVYLAMVDTNSLPAEYCEFNVIFTIFLYNQILDNYLCFRVNGGRRFNQTIDEWGFSKFISKKSLRDPSNGYLVDDKLVLGAEVFVFKTQRVIESVTLLQRNYSPRTRDWLIVEFSKLEDVWISGEFTVNNVEWKVKLYPNGHLSSNDGQISICLECVSADSFGVHQKIKTDFCIRLKGRLGSVRNSRKASRWFSSSYKCWGFTHFLSRGMMLDPENGFLVNDRCTIQLEMSMQVVVV